MRSAGDFLGLCHPDTFIFDYRAPSCYQTIYQVHLRNYAKCVVLTTAVQDKVKLYQYCCFTTLVSLYTVSESYWFL